MSAPRSTALRILALAGMAAMAAILASALASPARRLGWTPTLAPLPALAPRIEIPLPPAPASQQPSVPESKKGRPQSPPPVGGPQVPVPPATPESPAQNPIREISSQEAWAIFQAGAPFLDARRSSEFTEGHVAKAWCTPVWESDLDDRLLQFKAARRPGPEDPIVIYCSGGDCRDSHLLAAKLLNEGYFHLLIYRDGFPDWVAQGHPIEKGQP